MPDKRCAVVLGVDRIKALAPLQHAASGAARFAAWAEQQGIDVMLLTDADGGIVTLAAVKQAVKAYVEKRIYQQIIVFFSGHGILIAPDSEVWLLSEAPEDPDEAIVVPGSIFLARNAGIPHVVVISDACRSRPDGTHEVRRVSLRHQLLHRRRQQPHLLDVPVSKASALRHELIHARNRAQARRLAREVSHDHLDRSKGSSTIHAQAPSWGCTPHHQYDTRGLNPPGAPLSATIW